MINLLGGLLLGGLGGGHHHRPHGPMSMLPSRRVDYRNARYDGGVHPITPYAVEQPYTQGRVKGLFIGINYFGTAGELSGCINDVSTMLDTLKTIKFPLQEACILVDDPTFRGAGAPPTRDNIIKHMLWLVHDARPGDVLFLHYSGHGSQTKDYDGDEADGLDETLVPVDYKTAGTIVDDDIFEIVCRKLPAGVRLTAVMDCCHSGSLMDLPFTFVAQGNATGNSHMVADRAFHRRQTQGDVIMFSGCADDQTSSDVSSTAGFGNANKHGMGSAGGACTNALAQVLTRTNGLSYAELLNQMRAILRAKRYTQVPQLSSSKPVDMNKPFSLFGSFQLGSFLQEGLGSHQHLQQYHAQQMPYQPNTAYTAQATHTPQRPMPPPQGQYPAQQHAPQPHAQYPPPLYATNPQQPPQTYPYPPQGGPPAQYNGYTLPHY